MSWEGYSWLLLRVLGVTSQQLIHILQPFQARFPSSEQEFNGMQMTIRHMGHILENSYGNLASQLRAAPQNHGLAFPAFPADGGADPWHSGAADPLGRKRCL